MTSWLLLALITAPSVQHARIDERRYDAQLVRVIDGDSVVLRIVAPTMAHLPGQDVDVAVSMQQSVRLSGINTPELSRPKCERERQMATRAKDLLEAKLTGAKLVFVTRGAESEKFGRWLGNIEADGSLVTRSLIDAGLADPYDGGARDIDRWCR